MNAAQYFARRYPSPSYSFERWKRRAVYVVQVYTSQAARGLGDSMQLRTVGQYKREAAELRNAVAAELRRRRKTTGRRDVRAASLTIIAGVDGCW